MAPKTLSTPTSIAWSVDPGDSQVDVFRSFEVWHESLLDAPVDVDVEAVGLVGQEGDLFLFIARCCYCDIYWRCPGVGDRFQDVADVSEDSYFLSLENSSLLGESERNLS